MNATLAHRRNASLLIVFKPEGSVEILRFVQPLNAALCICVTVSGMLTVSNFLQRANAPPPIFTSPSGSITVTSSAMSRNPPCWSPYGSPDGTPFSFNVASERSKVCRVDAKAERSALKSVRFISTGVSVSGAVALTIFSDVTWSAVRPASVSALLSSDSNALAAEWVTVSSSAIAGMASMADNESDKNNLFMMYKF